MPKRIEISPLSVLRAASVAIDPSPGGLCPPPSPARGEGFPSRGERVSTPRGKWVSRLHARRGRERSSGMTMPEHVDILARLVVGTGPIGVALSSPLPLRERARVRGVQDPSSMIKSGPWMSRGPDSCGSGVPRPRRRSGTGSGIAGSMAPSSGAKCHSDHSSWTSCVSMRGSLSRSMAVNMRPTMNRIGSEPYGSRPTDIALSDFGTTRSPRISTVCFRPSPQASRLSNPSPCGLCPPPSPARGEGFTSPSEEGPRAPLRHDHA
jgi:hypothetical protein